MGWAVTGVLSPPQDRPGFYEMYWRVQQSTSVLADMVLAVL